MRALDKRFVAVYNDLKSFPSLEHVAEELDMSVKTVRNRAGEMRRMLGEGNFNVPELISRVGTGRTAPPKNLQPAPEFTSHKLVDSVSFPPRSRGVRRFIITSAQDESDVHTGFLRAIIQYADFLGDTEIMVAGFTYNKSVWDDEQGKKTSKRESPSFYHWSIRPYLEHKQIAIGDNLLFCAEMNTSPSATNPLTGFEDYTGSKWGIFPHAKQRLLTIATAKLGPTKHLLATGAITLPNYVKKRAGIKAEYHHSIGAVIVELMPDGTTFARHISTAVDGDGTFQDIDAIVTPNGVTTGHHIEALNPGDVHEEKLDPIVAMTTFGYDTVSRKKTSNKSLIDKLKPRHVFIHDLSDFAPRNHHNVSDPHFIFRTMVNGADRVDAALQGSSKFLRALRGGMPAEHNLVVVQSNHDNALLRWLKTADYREDPTNALFFLETQASYYRALAAGVADPPVFEDVLRSFDDTGLAGVQFVSEDSEYIICGDIECSMHGHLGANGSRGNPRQFAKMGLRSNTGHTHSPMLYDGAAVAGVSGKLDMGYNRGLSSWDHSHIITYPNGERCIITMRGNMWFAPRNKPKSSREHSACLV